MQTHHVSENIYIDSKFVGEQLDRHEFLIVSLDTEFTEGDNIQEELIKLYIQWV